VYVCVKGHLAATLQNVQTKRQIFVNRPGACERVPVLLGLLQKGTTKTTPDFDTTLNTVQSLSELVVQYYNTLS